MKKVIVLFILMPLAVCFAQKDVLVDIHKIYPEEMEVAGFELSRDQDVQVEAVLTKGYFTVESNESGLTINDLRFGLSNGWEVEQGDFVFAYNIKVSGSNTNQQLIISRKPVSINVSRAMLKLFWMRIKGT